jgi:hypothetical protein
MLASRPFVAALLLVSAAAFAQTPPALPAPAYGNTVYLYVEAPDLFGTDAAFQAAADTILNNVHGGPYARVGASAFLALDMPWNADLTNPILSSPAQSGLADVLTRAQARGLAVHLGAVAGLSRDVFIYDPAVQEDRRNAQWYADSRILRGATQPPSGLPDETWITPSRYARKLRRHLEAKVRAYAKELVDLHQQFPDTLTSASGDAEMELNFGALDFSAPFGSQMIADYSPFAVAEFRDWIRGAGLYGPGQPYDGQGLPGGRAKYGGPNGLTQFALDFGAAFQTWNLYYFDFDVMNDPIDGDPKAIPAAVYNAPGWTGLPVPPSADITPGGFDAPRSSAVPPPLWALWLQFREQMVANYQKDFASWMTTTPGTSGGLFEAQRWYSHQIPADYLGGTCPTCPNPNPRLRTSASPVSTADVAPKGSLGLTVFDVYFFDFSIGAFVYSRDTQFLLDALKARGVPNWGFVEWSPSWANGAFDPDVVGIAASAKHAFDTGAHILNFLEWAHFIGSPPANPTHIPQALDLFLSQVKNQPRDAGTVVYAPAQVSGIAGNWFSATITLSWPDLVFPGVTGFRWTDWPAFSHFEIWRGPTNVFTTVDGVKLADSATTSKAGIVPDASRPWYRVRAIARDGSAGAFSGAFQPAPSGSGFVPITPCRQLDTRQTAAVAASGSRVVTLTGAPCGIPATAKSVSANLTLTQTTAPGSLAILGTDLAGPATTSNISFSPFQTRGNNTMLFLPGDQSGTVRIENGSTGPLHVILDVNGYFQ